MAHTNQRSTVTLAVATQLHDLDSVVVAVKYQIHHILLGDNWLLIVCGGSGVVLELTLELFWNLYRSCSGICSGVVLEFALELFWNEKLFWSG